MKRALIYVLLSMFLAGCLSKRLPENRSADILEETRQGLPVELVLWEAELIGTKTVSFYAIVLTSKSSGKSVVSRVGIDPETDLAGQVRKHYKTMFVQGAPLRIPATEPPSDLQKVTQNQLTGLPVTLDQAEYVGQEEMFLFSLVIGVKGTDIKVRVETGVSAEMTLAEHIRRYYHLMLMEGEKLL
ncbi:hypothetical protein ACFL0Z_03805 [Patescibacteria group bacterium]